MVVQQQHYQRRIRVDAPADATSDTLKGDSTSNVETTKPLAPPPRPNQQQTGSTPDFFTGQTVGGSLSLEPNPFEQSFGAPPETPGGTKLPPVASLTSPSSLLPGTGTTPFNWGPGSLRTGPLSPAMLSAPANDYFGDTHLRGSFPTPNESSMRTGLTPGGSGSMFPAPSPNSQALFALPSGGATPNTIDFHRTALSAAAKQQLAPAAQSVTSQPQDGPNGVAAIKAEAKAAAGPFDPHDNDAANGLFLLAQGRNGTPAQPQFAAQPQQQVHAHPTPMPAQTSNTSPQMNGAGSVGSGSLRGGSEAGSAMSEESEPARPNTRGKGKRSSGAVEAPTTNGRRKASEAAAKGPANKKAKTNGGAAAAAATAAAMMNGMSPDEDSDDDDDDDDMKPGKDGQPKQKMTEEEKRKNFLERNRVAALKCRQRKKQWLANLQSKVEIFGAENEALNSQISALREEVVNLKTLLLAHKDCPITQQQGLQHAFMQQSMEQFNPQMNPYGMAAPPLGQPLVAAQVGGRRYS